jgi:hypothetical protein
MKEKSCAYGSSGGLRRAGWTLTADKYLWFVEAHLG